MYKILCTGNPSKVGIPKEIQKIYPNTIFASKTNNWNLLDTDTFINKIKDFNVFVNHSSFNYTIQIDLLNATYATWKKHNICGHIINIGSIVEYEFGKEWNLPYHTQKVKLRNRSIELASEDIKTTHLIVGGIKTHGSNHPEQLDCSHIAQTIKYVIDHEYNITIMSLEKIKNDWFFYNRSAIPVEYINKKNSKGLKK